MVTHPSATSGPSCSSSGLFGDLVFQSWYSHTDVTFIISFKSKIMFTKTELSTTAWKLCWYIRRLIRKHLFCSRIFLLKRKILLNLFCLFIGVKFLNKKNSELKEQTKHDIVRYFLLFNENLNLLLHE